MDLIDYRLLGSAVNLEHLSARTDQGIDRNCLSRHSPSASIHINNRGTFRGFSVFKCDDTLPNHSELNNPLEKEII